MTSNVGFLPELAPEENEGVWKRRVGAAVLVVALVVGFAFFPSYARVVAWLQGEGHVGWRLADWQAKQAALSYKLPLVVYRLPSAEAEHRNFKRVLRDESVRKLTHRFIWHKSIKAGQTAEVVIYSPDGETVLEGPFDPGTVASDEFLVALAEAMGAAEAE